MGMYAGVRGVVTLKPDFVGVVQEACSDWGWETTGHALLDDYEQRAVGLPFAPLTPLGTDTHGLAWDTDGLIPTHLLTPNEETREWAFMASCKNTDSSLYFIHTILPYIAESSSYLEYYTEEQDYSKLYCLKDGVIMLEKANHTYYGDKSVYPGRRNPDTLDSNEGTSL